LVKLLVTRRRHYAADMDELCVTQDEPLLN